MRKINTNDLLDTQPDETTSPAGHLARKQGFSHPLIVAGLLSLSLATTSVLADSSSKNAGGLRPLDPVFQTAKAINYGADRELGPEFNERTSDENILEDLKLLDSAGFNLIRLFSSDANDSNVVRLASKHYPKMRFQTGIFLDGFEDCDSPANQSRVMAAINLANDKAFKNIVAVSVGNETFFGEKDPFREGQPGFRPDVPVACVADYLKMVRGAIKQPVTSTQLMSFYTNTLIPTGGLDLNPQPILSEIDFVQANSYPWYNDPYFVQLVAPQLGIPVLDWRQLALPEGPARGRAMIEAAVDLLFDDVSRLANVEYLGKKGRTVSVGETLPIVIGETGWKSYRTDPRPEPPEILPIPLPTPLPAAFFNTVNPIEPYGATPGSQRLYRDLIEARLRDSHKHSKSGRPTKPVAIFYFAAFDASWKPNFDNGWGLWTVTRSPKEALCHTSAGGDCSESLDDMLGYYPKQVTNTNPDVTVNPDNVWYSYINVYNLSPEPWYSNYLFGFQYNRQFLPGFFGSSGPGKGTLTFRPNTEIYTTNKALENRFWVDENDNPQPRVLAGSYYVENLSLAGQKVTFSGETISNTLGVDPLTGFQYLANVFILGFPSDLSYNTKVEAPLTTGGQFNLELDLKNRPDITIVQYGFEIIGPITTPSIVDSLGSVVVKVPTVTPVTKDHKKHGKHRRHNH